MFITFEGIEGSGKSLQIERAVAYLTGRGVRCMVTREPGGTLFGRAVRQVLLHAGGPRREPICELLLYLADRYQHLQEVVLPSLRNGMTVISDRYHDASRAYQGAGRGLTPELLDELAGVLQIPEPDNTILLDIEPSVGLQRARMRNDATGSALVEGRFEAEDLDFHRGVRNAYLALAQRFPDRIHVVDGTGTPEAVQARIQVLLDQWFPLQSAER